MKTDLIKVAGYVRVSSKEQVDGESLTTQRKSITDFASKQGYELTEIYADEGISGGNVKDRHALLRCISEGQAGKFNILIVHRLSRFGRNANELLNNHMALKEVGIELISISEKIDFTSTYGGFMLIMLAAVAQLERDIIKETTLENRIAIGKKGIPTSGAMPYARTFNKETGEWELNEDKARVIREVAEEYLKGGSLLEIAKRVHMSYNGLVKRLRGSGDKWTVRFKDEDPITYTTKHILEDSVIEEIEDRLVFNRRNNRTDIVYKYILSGFIRCEKCLSAISGQTFHSPKKDYRYYYHRGHPTCKSFNYIHADQIEKAVFETIFENIIDVPSFERAIANSLPDINMVDGLKLKIENGKKELIKIQKELDKLVKAVIEETLSKETIKGKEDELYKAKKRFTDEVNESTQQLKSLPDVNVVKKEADTIRRKLLKHLGSKDHLSNMTFDDKRALLHWVFDGKDYEGTPYGIYITVKDGGRTGGKGRGRVQTVDYYLYGKVTGLRTLKGDDINYMGDVDEELRKEQEKEEDNNNYKTKTSATLPVKRSYNINFKMTK